MSCSTRGDVEISQLWVLALASKCESLTPFNIIIIFIFSFLILNLIFWAHPGGPAWGKYKWSPCPCTPIIPGPKGFPIIGSMGLMTGLAHHKLAAAAEAAQAKRLMALSLGNTRAIVTCNPDVAKEILISSTFADRPAMESAYHLMFNRSIGFAPYGLYWTTLRKIADAHLFSPNQLKASEPQRLRIANLHLLAPLIAAAGGTAPIRVRDFLKRASLNNMMCTVFGDDAVSASEELHHLVDEGYDLLGQLNWSDHLPFLAQFDLQKVRFRCSRLLPRVNCFVRTVIAHHNPGTGDFLDVLSSLQGLSNSDMIALLWEMIFRGTDTVAVLIEWILARLVLHPDVQSKVHHELDNVVGRSRAVNESHLTELVYLTAVVKEVLRLHPPGPLLSWSRLSIRDSSIDGCHVPKGTTAMVNMWAIMRDPQLWPHPLLFNPHRFLGSSNSGLSIFGSDPRIAPFGSGRRSCPGKTLGMSTVNFWVATLLQEFEFESNVSVDLSEELRLSCEMANPLMVKVRPRRCN